MGDETATSVDPTAINLEQMAKEWHSLDVKVAKRILDQADKERDHRRSMEERLFAHREKMDKRLWATQLLTAFGGLACLITLAVRGADASSLGSLLTLLGAGTGFSAGLVAVGRSISKRVGQAPDLRRSSENAGTEVSTTG